MTVRDRDSLAQVRLPIGQVAAYVQGEVSFERLFVLKGARAFLPAQHEHDATTSHQTLVFYRFERQLLAISLLVAKNSIP